MANAPTPADPQPRPPARRAVAAPRAAVRTPDPHFPDAVCHVLTRQSHVDAGRIDKRILVVPELAANRDRWTALAQTMRT